MRSASSGRLLVFALFFLSGGTALIYQTAWVRSLTLVFGASHEAVGIVLAAFMGGLALGGFVFGRWSMRLSRPLLVYGLLEAGIAVIAALLPWLLDLVDGIYLDAARASDGVPTSLNVMRAGLAGGVLLLPTFLMGGTLPVLAKLLVARSEQFGLRLSQLYAINTTGAVVGALAAGFVLLPRSGVRSTELLAVGLNVLIAVAAIVADRRSQPISDTGLAASKTPPGPPLDREALPRDRLIALRLTFFGTAVSGMCALALEVMWMRAISVAIGTTTYSFTVMLSAFLVGIALGSWLHAAFPLKRIRIELQFGVVLMGIGLASMIFAQRIPDLPRLAVLLNTSLHPEGSGLRLGTALFTSFAVMLVPCILMGVAFPLAAQARASMQAAFGRSVGDVVGLNTLGAIVGSVLAGFVLIPRLGLQRGMLVVAAANLAYGLIVTGFATASALPARRRTALVTAAALVAVTVAAPALLPDWDIRVLASFQNNFRANLRAADGSIAWDRLFGSTEILYYQEGRSSSVSVIESGPTRAILIDGKSVASDSLTDMQHELLLGHLPVLLHPHPHSAAVIGLGAGITLGSVLAHPGAMEQRACWWRSSRRCWTARAGSST